MKTTYLGRSGLRVSPLCLGTYNFGTKTEEKEAFEILSIQGKIRYVGSSNFPGWCLAMAQAKASQRHLLGLVSEQHRYNLLCRLPELEVLPAAQHLGVGVLAYSPLAAGRLTCKQLDGQAGANATQTPDKKQNPLIAFSALCKELGAPPANVAQAWIMTNPAVSCVVCGPRTKEHLAQSLRIPDIALDEDTMKALDAIFPGPGGAAPEAYAW